MKARGGASSKSSIYFLTPISMPATPTAPATTIAGPRASDADVPWDEDPELLLLIDKYAAEQAYKALERKRAELRRPFEISQRVHNLLLVGVVFAETIPLALTAYAGWWFRRPRATPRCIRDLCQRCGVCDVRGYGGGGSSGPR